MSKIKRRTYGDGSLYQAGDGYWVATLELGFGPDGKRKRWKGKSRTQAGALAKLRDARKRKHELGTAVHSAKPLADWLKVWLRDIAKPSVRPKTYTGYADAVNKINAVIGHIPLHSLSPAHVRTLRTAASSTSINTANAVHRVLKAALSDAEREGLVPRNVAKLVPMPAATGTRNALPLADARRLVAELKTRTDSARWLLALLTGMRQGEALGLRWQNIDFETGMIEISWQLQKLPMRHGCRKACGHKRASTCPDAQFDIPAGFEHLPLDGANCLIRPKSIKGIRLIPAPPVLLDALRRHKRETLAIPNTHDLVFTRADGGPTDAKTDRETWGQLLDSLGIDRVDLHSARHTAATLLMAEGIDVKIVQAVLGHAQASTTQIYQHSDQTMARRALEALAAALT